ncbi:MAG TPA: DNA polymerase/3'-5' exonuclease PolX [Nevskiaceae bacterium]|nr:DNA polymerase/3'-5' exonuclease PolX [Nevskiaceae bacterium]
MKMNRNLNNQEVACLLQAIAAAYEVKNSNRFKIIAYDRAATAVENATSEVKDLWDDGKLRTLPGIGASIAQHLDELFRTGKVKHFNRLIKGLPPAMFEFLSISGIGAKTAYKLCQELEIKRAKTALVELEKAAKKGKIALLEGFGEKSQTDILEAILDFKKGRIKKKRMPLSYADAVAQDIIVYLKKSPATLKIDPLGSLKRRVATVGDIDIAVATKKPTEVVSWFVAYPKKKKLIEKGPTGASILLKGGCQVDLRVQKPEAYGSMLQYFIGSKHHNIHLREFALKKGLSLSEHGIKKGKKLKEYATEEQFYHDLGLPWIPPEIREDTGEIEVAQKGELPNLVKTSDIKGDFHLHSNYPLEPSHDEGKNSMEEMAMKAIELGYEYIGFSEHNPSLSHHSEKQIIDLVKRKNGAVEQLKSSCNKITLLNGLEVDIRPNGQLAFPEKGFDLLDYVVASIHSSFKMNKKEMTRRVLAGLEHPKVKILGHPTGRKLGQREGYELNWEKVFAFCKKADIWLEINAWPDRLDLPDVLVREAVKNGVKMVINTDSHALSQMGLMPYGVSVARRGWAEKSDIINTLSWLKLNARLKRT